MIKQKLTSAKLVKWGFERPLDSTESSMYSLCSRDLPMLAETCRTLPAIVYHSIRSQLSNSFEVSSKYFVAKFVSKLSVSKLRKNLRVFITRETTSGEWTFAITSDDRKVKSSASHRSTRMNNLGTCCTWLPWTRRLQPFISPEEIIARCCI